MAREGSHSQSVTTGGLRARHTFKSFFFGTVIGQVWFALCTSFILVWTFTIIWTQLPACDDCGYDASLADAIWLAWGIFFDPGTQTGLETKATSLEHKLVAALFSIFGFVFNLAVLGVIVEWIRNTVARYRKHHKCIVANDHTVILGWTDKTLFLIKELAQMLSDSQDRSGLIVVVGEVEEPQMLAELRMAYPHFRQQWPHIKVKCMFGRPHEVDDLERVSVWAAKHIVVLGTSRRPRVADSHTITTLCALRCLPDPLAPNSLVVAELKLSQNKPVARQLGGHGGSNKGLGGAAAKVGVLPVAAGPAVDALLVLCALNPIVGSTVMDLMSFSGNQIEVVAVKHHPHSKLLVGKSFGEIRWRFQEAVVIGVVHAGGVGETRMDAMLDGEKVKKGKSTPLHTHAGEEGGGDESDAGPQMVLAPSDDVIVRRDDLLIFCSEDLQDASKLDVHEVREKPPKSFAFLAKQASNDTDHILPEGMRVHHESRGWGTVTDHLTDGRTKVTFDNGEEHKYRKASLHKLIPKSKDGTPSFSPNPMGEGSSPVPREASSPMRGISKLLAEVSKFSEPTTADEATMAHDYNAPENQPPDKPGAAVAAWKVSSDGTQLGRFGAVGQLAQTKPQVVLLVGWTPGIGSLLRAFDARLLKGSELFVLSEKTLKWRTTEMAAEGMELDGRSVYALDQDQTDVHTPRSQRGPRDAVRGRRKSAGSSFNVRPGGRASMPDPDVREDAGPSAPPAAGGNDGLGGARPDELGSLNNITVRHLVGYTTDLVALRRLPIARASVAVIVADVDDRDASGYGGSELQIADSEAMTSTILLRRLRDELCEDDSDTLPLRLVTQMSDVLSRRLLDQQPDLLDAVPHDDSIEATLSAREETSAALIFHRNYIETTALSVATHSGVSWSTLRMLLYPFGGADIELVPVASCMVPAERARLNNHPMMGQEGGRPMLSFWDLAERVRELDMGVLIGWSRVTSRKLTGGSRRAEAASQREGSVRGGGGMGVSGRAGSMKRSGSRRAHSTSTGAHNVPMDHVELNPANKAAFLPWGPEDELLVLKEQKAPTPEAKAFLAESSIAHPSMRPSGFGGTPEPQHHEQGGLAPLEA